MDPNVAPVITSIASLIAALASLGAVALGVLNRAGVAKIGQQVEKVDKATNGMKTELVAEVRAAAWLQGEKQGKAEEKADETGKGSPKIDPPAGAVSG